MQYCLPPDPSLVWPWGWKKPYVIDSALGILLRNYDWTASVFFVFSDHLNVNTIIVFWVYHFLHLMDIDIYFPRRMLHTSRQNANPLEYSNSYLASLAYLAIYFCVHMEEGKASIWSCVCHTGNPKNWNRFFALRCDLGSLRISIYPHKIATGDQVRDEQVLGFCGWHRLK